MPLAAWPVSSAFSDSLMRGAVPWPSRSSGTKAAPMRRRSVTLSEPAALPSMTMLPSARRQPLAGKRGEQFVLAVAGNAGDADDLAAAHLERDVLADACHADRPARSDSSWIDAGAARGAARSAAAFTSPISAPTIMRASDAAVSWRGIAGRDLLAAAQDRRGVAEPFHLVELVADVEDRAALALEPIEHDEELIGLLRRQHRGRLVEDEKLRILHQRAHDLDALALADRQPPHLALGIERQAVNARGFGAAAPRSRRRSLAGGRPSATFSATVRFSNSEKC